MRFVLSIAGSDTSAGAGIQQDLKTITALGHYALTVTTALTAQNSLGVRAVMPVPVEVLGAQIDAVLEDFELDAVKIGMLPELESARVVVDRLVGLGVPVVCDPVMVSTSGTVLMSEVCRRYVVERLFPLCSLVTPNIPEALCLSDLLGCGGDADDLVSLGWDLVGGLGASVLLKGGHGSGDVMCDRLFRRGENDVVEFSSPRIVTSNLHGTGCTLSSAIAAFLAEGLGLEVAVARAKGVVDLAIRNAAGLRLGHGNGALWLGGDGVKGIT